MTDLKQKPREVALLALTTIAQMYSSSELSRKLEIDDQRQFEMLVGTWARGLSGLERADVERGLQTVMKNGSTFAPSLPEFRQLCKQPLAMHREYKPLPKPKASKEIAQSNIASMRAALNSCTELKQSDSVKTEADSYLDAYGRFIRGTAP